MTFDPQAARRIAFAIVRVLLLTYIGLTLFLAIFQRAYIYHPFGPEFGDCPIFAQDEAITHGTARFYHVDQAAPVAIVVLHGNAGGACDRTYYRDLLGSADVSFLYVEYAGYAGDPTGPRMERVLADLHHLSRYLNARDYTRVVVVGESLGTGPAAYLARLLDPSSLGGIVLVSPYPELASVASHHFPLVPIRFFLLDNYTPAAWLADSTAPVFALYATHDEVIPAELTRTFAETLPDGRIELYEVEAGHNDLLVHPEAIARYVAAITRFLGDTP